MNKQDARSQKSLIEKPMTDANNSHSSGPPACRSALKDKVAISVGEGIISFCPGFGRFDFEAIHSA